MNKILSVLLALCLMFLLVGPPAAAQGEITLIDLGTLGGFYTYAYAINDQGQVIGNGYTVDGDLHAFFWENGVMTDLGTLGGVTTLASAINAQGQVVGYSYTVSGYNRAFVWENGVMTDLGTLGGNSSVAEANNDLGRVVGGSTLLSGGSHAFLWDNGVMTDLGTLGGNQSIARNMNERGQVVGDSRTTEGSSRAFLWENGVMTDLGAQNGTYSGAFMINEHGQIVGNWGNPDDEEDCGAFLWENGVVTDLGTLGGNQSIARSLNERGQIVGNSKTASGESHPFLWENGVMTDLGFRGVAFAINDLGQIVGQNFYGQGFLWENGIITLLERGVPRTLNNVGQVVGTDGSHAVLWQLPLPPSYLSATIDVNPKSARNIINILYPKTVSVAILSSDDFDAVTQVVRPSLTFGRTGDETSLYYVPPMGKLACTASDTNADGLADLLCIFSVAAMGFQCSDIQGILKGNLRDGTPIQGQDAVKIAPCP